MLENILNHLKDNGWSADNIAFGSGGGLLQKLNRDTQKCAFKCSLAIVDGEEVFVHKDPVTDPGKKSKQGITTCLCTEIKTENALQSITVTMTLKVMKW